MRKVIKKKKEIPAILADDGTSYEQKVRGRLPRSIERSSAHAPFLIIANSNFPSSLSQSRLD
jgi:hypothetical protein